MVKHVAGCEHTAHLGCLKKNGVEPILGNQSGDHVVQHLLPQGQGSYPIFLLNPKSLQLLCILCSLFTKGSAFLQVLFPSDSPATSFPSSHHPLLTLQPCDFRRPSTLRFANVPINFHPLHHAPRAPFATGGADTLKQRNARMSVWKGFQLRELILRQNVLLLLGWVGWIGVCTYHCTIDHMERFDLELWNWKRNKSHATSQLEHGNTIQLG